MKQLLIVLALSLFATSAWAGFINGGFEDGNFNGWTLGGNTGDSAVVSAGTDTNASGLLNTVSADNHAARVGNQSGSYHSSSISQRVNNWQDTAVWFAWAALLQEPTNGVPHSALQMPDYSVTLRDLSTGITLYSQIYNITTLPPTGWQTGATNSVAGSMGLWHYSDWYAVNLDTSSVMGHDLLLSFASTDCSLGGHGGYMYVDQVGSSAPIIPTVPEPSTLLLFGAGLGGLAFWLREKRS